MGGEGGNQWVFDECDVNIWSVFYGAAENNIGRLSTRCVKFDPQSTLYLIVY